MEQVITIPYAPRKEMYGFHMRTQRWAILVTHRGYGKTQGVINDLIKRALECDSVSPRFAYVAPYLSQAKSIAWSYLKRFSDAIPGRLYNESALSVTFPGDRVIRLFGADNFEALRGLHLHGLVVDESEQVPAAAHDVLYNCLTANQGWRVKIGTIRGGKGLYKEWDEARNDPKTFTLFLPADQSGVIPPEVLAEDKADNPVRFAREMMLDPSAEIEGTIYGKQMAELRAQNRLTRVNMVPDSPLYSFWDIGHSKQGDSWCIWLIQVVGRDVLVLDYYARTGELPAHYADVILGWEGHYKKRIMNYLPHDGDRLDRNGRSAKDDLEAAGLAGRVRTVTRTENRWESINDVRALLANVYINQETCTREWTAGGRPMPSGVQCLDYYRKKVVKSTGMVSEEPEHDNYSHGADAFRTFSEAYGKRLLSAQTTSDYPGSGAKAQIVASRTPPEKQRWTQRPITVTR